MRCQLFSIQKAAGFGHFISLPGSDFLRSDGQPKALHWRASAVRLPSDGKHWDVSTIYGPPALVLTERARSMLAPFFGKLKGGN